MVNSGYQYKNNKISVQVFVHESGIPEKIIKTIPIFFFGVGQLNFFKKSGTDVPVNQAGWASVIRGSMNFEFFG
jgi:hypothetical protein